MNKLILCEGKTDVVLLDYYLKEVAGWQDDKATGKKTSKRPNITPINNHQFTKWYEKEGDYLLLCSVGGNTRFEEFIEKKIKSPQQKEDSFEKISIVIDRDAREIQDIENDANKILKVLSPEAKLQNNNWIDCRYKNRFKEDKSFQALLVVVPKKGSGALETLMLKAISENENTRKIVDKTRSFVEQMRKKEASNYIKNDSLERKAHWGLTWAILYPETVFMPFDEQIKKVHWEESDTLRNCFSKLIEI